MDVILSLRDFAVLLFAFSRGLLLVHFPFLMPFSPTSLPPNSNCYLHDASVSDTLITIQGTKDTFERCHKVISWGPLLRSPSGMCPPQPPHIIAIAIHEDNVRLLEVVRQHPTLPDCFHHIPAEMNHFGKQGPTQRWCNCAQLNPSKEFLSTSTLPVNAYPLVSGYSCEVSNHVVYGSVDVLDMCMH